MLSQTFVVVLRLKYFELLSAKKIMCCGFLVFVTTFALKWFFSSMVPVKYLQSNFPFFHTFQKNFCEVEATEVVVTTFALMVFPK